LKVSSTTLPIGYRASGSPHIDSVFFCALSSYAQSQSKEFLGFPLNREMRLVGLCIPLAADGSTDLGRLVFEEVSIQSKNFGTLYVGIFPELVVDGLRVEISSNGDYAQAIARLRAILCSERLLNNARIQRFSIRDSAKTEILQARQARIAENCSSLALEGIRTGSTNIRSAFLSLHGDQAGKLLRGPSRRPLTLSALTQYQQSIP
jgi:hypothetical protein